MWTYKSEVKVSTGYEDVLPTLKTYTKEKFERANELEKEIMIEEVFEIYRKKNIFPIQYFNDEGIASEIKKCIDKDVNCDGNILALRFNQGGAVCRYLFPNLHEVECKGTTNNSLINRFMDDHKLKRAIKLSLSIKNSVTPSEIRAALELIGGNVATNFKPMNAKALYELYVPNGGIIYDFAAGFGGRMLGALSSKNNYKYIAVEPNSRTYDGLLKLGEYIESVTGRRNSFQVFKVGSENFKLKKKNFVDFAFSSPPYFNLEKYSDEETQCYNKYNEIDEWLEKYVRPTIKNIYDILKDNGKYAVNIADFKIGNKEIAFVEDWIRISEEEGFEHINTISMKLVTRKGKGNNNPDKKEGIFVFTKKRTQGQTKNQII